MAMFFNQFSLGTAECCLRVFIKVSEPLFDSAGLLSLRHSITWFLSFRHGYLLLCGYFDLFIPISHTGYQPPWYFKWWFSTRCRCRGRFRFRDTFRGTFWSWCLGMIRGRGSMETFLLYPWNVAFSYFSVSAAGALNISFNFSMSANTSDWLAVDCACGIVVCTPVLLCVPSEVLVSVLNGFLLP